MKAIERAGESAVEALRALRREPESRHRGAIDIHIREALSEVASLRRGWRTADTAVATRASGRLLLAALLAQRGAVAAGAAPSDAARLLMDACRALLEVESANRTSTPRAGERPVLRTADAVRRALEAHGHLRGVRVIGLKSALDLASVDLAGSEWHEVDLRGSNLRGADASLARFTKSSLSSSNLAGTKFDDASLRELGLEGCDLQGASFVRAEISGATLAGAELAGTTWDEAHAENLDIQGARAPGVDFSRAHKLSVSNARGADLAGARFEGAVLAGLDFTETVLRGAALVGCLLTETTAEGIDIEGCDLTDSTWKRAKLRGIAGAGVRAHRACFSEADLRQARLPGLDAPHADASGVSLEGADLTGGCFRSASFERASLNRVIARDTNLERARLVGADMRSSSFAGASLRYADLSHARLDQSTFVGAALTHANLHRCSREGADFTDADLTGARATDPDRARAEDFRRPT